MIVDRVCYTVLEQSRAGNKLPTFLSDGKYPGGVTRNKSIANSRGLKYNPKEAIRSGRFIHEFIQPPSA